jgi:hypothetical protein
MVDGEVVGETGEGVALGCALCGLDIGIPLGVVR